MISTLLHYIGQIHWGLYLICCYYLYKSAQISTTNFAPELLEPFGTALIFLGFGISLVGLKDRERSIILRFGDFLSKILIVFGVILGLSVIAIGIYLAVFKGLGISHKVVIGLFSVGIGFLTMMGSELRENEYFDL